MSFETPLSLLPTETSFNSRWMLHVSSEMQNEWREHFLSRISSVDTLTIRKLEQDFLILESPFPLSAKSLLQTIYPRWVSPIEHQWPTNPEREGFAEKAAQALHERFAGQWAQVEFISTTQKLKRIAVGVKGRMLQLSETPRLPRTIENLTQIRPSGAEATNQAETISENLSKEVSARTTLAVLIDKKGLFAGLNPSRLHMGTVLPGGLGFLGSQPNDSNNTKTSLPSRAGGKIQEVLSLLQEIQVNAQVYRQWLELGAAPGGMTQTLLNWGAHVTAIDLAAMSPSVLKHPRLKHLAIHAQDIKSAFNYDALLSDMNGPYQLATTTVANLARTMRTGSLIIFTLKLPDIKEAESSIAFVTQVFKNADIELICIKHLFHNRRELTVIGKKKVKKN